MESGGGRAGIQREVAGDGRGGGGWVLVEARLQGGAPWGFTLQGGLEHGEPLIISKVEEGGKADSLEQPLLVGDEIIIINDVELTGYRQEAIALVKGSYKTLQLTVRREFDPGYIKEFDASPPRLPTLPPSPPPFPSPPPPPPPPQQQQTTSSSQRSRTGSTGGVQLRIKNRRNEPSSRPHSWHSTKLGEGHQDSEQDRMDAVSNTWHHNYHTSASTTDLSGGFDSGGSYLRKSPDQYSSRGSMDSLDHPHLSQLHSGVQHHHPLGHHAGSGPHPAYSSCHQLSSARSSNSIDHLHSKRDSAYSSFSTSSSIPEYLASTPSFSPERSYSLETVPQKRGSGEMQQADLRYIQSVYDTHQSRPQEHERTSNALLHNCDSRGGGGTRPGVCYRSSSSSSSSGSSSGGMLASNRHSVGPVWGLAGNRSSYESLKGAPAPPRRSDSYAAIRNHERPNSWSNLEHARSLRSLPKSSWHHSSGPVASGAAKGSYGTEGGLHTVIEKSPESSPTIKPRQGGGFPQIPSPLESSTGPSGHASQTGRAILPTSVYPAPQPEPHYAQIPRRSIDEGVTEGQKNGTTTENGHPNNTPSSPYPHPSYSASSQLRTQAHEAERHQQEESNLAHYKPHQKPAGGRTDGQTRAQRPPNHLEPQSQSFQGSYVSKSQGPHSQVFQEQNHVPKIQSDPDFRSLSSHERRDPFTPVQSRGDRRTADQSSIHSDPVAYSRAAQGQAPPPHLPVHSQPQAPPTFTSQTSSRHHSDHHWEHREQDKDKEHPLTRLEIALAEVQRCGDDNVVSASSHGSVMEKISRFERRDHGGKQRSHSTSNTHKGSLQRMTEKGRNVSCGADDLRTMLERSTNGTKAHRTLSYRASSSDHVKYRAPADPSSALQRSRSSFQLDKSRESDKDFPRRQEMLGPMQETSQNRSYKEAQSKVLRSTSFRRRDLNSAMSPPPPVPPPVYSSSSQQSPPVPAKYHSLEKKGPKTMPKPQGIIITPQPVISPHTPKERHVVSPEVRGPSPPALPNIPPVGPPAMMRICGRKRLTADQKKRSFSEPENMNEIGVSDSQTSALFRRGGENSVADRRKMFELAASRIGGGAPQNTASRPDLRQIQHDALTEYVERKRGVKGGQSSGQRPRSAYVQHDNSKHTVSSCYSDTYSLSSASSLLSLQESDLRNLPSNLLYPGRVTTPRPPAQPPQGACGSPTELQAQILEDFSRQSQSLSTHPGLHQQQQAAETHHNLGLSKQLSGALHRAGSGRSSGKSMSAEDLLEQSGERQITPQHYRSRSSPIMEMSNKDFSTSDVRMVGVYISEPGRCALAGDSRPADTQVPGPVSPQSSQNNQSSIHPAGLFLDTGSSNTPVTRRERQRNSERQRAQSTSTLAASVGLPCPFSPPGTQDGGGSEWQASDRLSLANLDAITFPDIPQTNASDGGKDAVNTTGINETMVMDRQTRHSFNDMLEDTEKDVYRDRAYSLEAKGAHSPQNAKQLSPVTPTPLSHSQLTVPSNRRGSTKTESSSSYPSMRHLSSLRISESSLYSISDQQQPLQTSTGLLEENFDEVFLQNPPPPSPPPPVKETSIIDDFPPPPPPIELEQETVHQSVQSCSSEFLNHTGISIRKSSLPQTPTSPTSSGFPLPAPSTITVEDSLEYEPLPKREKTSEELRVEALTRQLVLHDSSLLPLLDMWGVKSIVELMEEIFPNGRLVEKPLWQHRGSGQLDNSIQDGISDSTAALDQISLDEGEKDLNTRKVELCEALRSSLDALQQEKELLSEEQRHHQALGSSIEALVQERLKTNERDKYSMFIGDLERIVNLLLSLCSRLSRIDRALFALEREDPTQGDTAEEKDSLHHKRSLLLRQTEDAWELKENLDRRQRVVHAILSGYLTEPQLQDYRRYVSTKPSLLIRRRHLEELIRQGEDQLTRLTESLPAELAETHGWSKACPFILPNPAPCPSPFPKLLPQSVMPGPAHTVRSATVTSL